MNDTEFYTVDIAVVGGGFGGVACAQHLEREPLQVGVISRENYAVFQPMLAEVCGGTVSPRHVINPLRLLCPDSRIFRGEVARIDLKERILYLNAGDFAGTTPIRYDELVLALGSDVDFSKVPGMAEHAFPMQNVGDAMRLRATIISRLEEASVVREEQLRRRLLSFVIVGGGYSGVETAGQILDLLQSILKHYPELKLEETQVTLIHSRDHLLPTLDVELGDYSAKCLKDRGLRLLLNTRVKAVTATHVTTADRLSIPSSTVISTVGTTTNSLVAALIREYQLPTREGRVETNPYGQVQGREHLWALGDCAWFPKENGESSPGTAQFATRQGTLVAKNIINHLHERPLQPFSFKGLGELAAIGHHSAVAHVLGVKFSGFLAWWLWRSIYLMKLPTFNRKLRVVLDWTLDLFFSKDINQLSPRYSERLRESFYEPGDVIFEKGDPAFSVYLIKEGTVAYQKEGETCYLVQGEYFGGPTLEGSKTWPVTAVAEDQTQLILISGQVYLQMEQCTKEALPNMKF